ncbi:lactococcin family bacteriocin (plasmid) [Lactococcus lactis subsp. lactis]|uniref:lactococcin family bacteriocin n=1 Tax=Lactococcus lactis TaxID=1358 RepID=UPI0037479A82
MKNPEHDLKPFKILSDKELQEVNGGSLQYVMSAGPYTWYKDTRTGKTICKQTIDTASYTFGVMAEGWGKTFH